MIYLFIGEDAQAKDKKIDAVKKKFLSSHEAVNFDFDILYAPKLDPADLKKVLVSLPVFSACRVVLIRQSSELSAYNKQLILECASQDHKKLALIIDYEVSDDNNFIKKLGGSAEVAHFSGERPQNAFDMTNAIGLKKPREALKILDSLLQNGDHPLQIMGALVWFWGNKAKGRISKEVYKKGLLELQEADLNIKRSRIRPEYAVEVLVVKLSSLIAG